MKTIVKQIKNANGTFQYVVNGEIHLKASKKDYTFFLDEVYIYSNSLKTIMSQKSYWTKNGNNSVNKENLNVIIISK